MICFWSSCWVEKLIIPPISLLDEFRSFALTHPEYAKLFTTYIELQRYQALQGEDPEHNGTSHASNASQEDSASDKKDDW